MNKQALIAKIAEDNAAGTQQATASTQEQTAAMQELATSAQELSAPFSARGYSVCCLVRCS